MRLTRYYILIFIIVMLLVICSCTKGGSDLNIEISPPDKSLVDLASKIYDETELLELMKFNGSLNELNIPLNVCGKITECIEYHTLAMRVL